MAVVKLTSSGKAVQFIDDQGNVFQTTAGMITSLIGKQVAHSMVVLTRLPIKAAPDRFQVSPLYNPEGRVEDGTLSRTQSNDAFSPKLKKDFDQQKQFEDKQVW